jgi:AraC-like DNA-binding protein
VIPCAKSRRSCPNLLSVRHFNSERSAWPDPHGLASSLSRSCPGPGERRNALRRRTGKKASERAPRATAYLSLDAIGAYLRSCLADRTAPRVSELARKLRVSRGTLITFVKKLRGTTPAKYFRQRQIQLAQKLLRRGWSIERVARYAGFGTRRTFFRSFRTETGVTPDAYRIEQNVPRQHHHRRDRLDHKAGDN